jgi:uncharacterized protein YbjT (DUF2867 family)
MAEASIVVIAGASGVVGRQVLSQLLTQDTGIQVVAVGRRPLPQTHPQLVSQVVDLQNAEAVRRVLPEGVTLAMCCLGTTMKHAGSKAAFQAVDRDAVENFARAAREQGAQRCLLVSALGADTPDRIFYLRTKGEAEEALQRLGFPQLTVIRPSLIDDEGTRLDSRTGERVLLPVARALFSLIGRSSRYAPVRASVIARALIRLAFDQTSERVRIVESDQLHRLGT